MKRATLFLLSCYKRLISPNIECLLGKGCRFKPTCSEYAFLGIKRLGLLKGGILSIKRFLRCHPFSSGYYDPVPRNSKN